MSDLLIYAAVLLIGFMLGLQVASLLLPPRQPEPDDDLTFEEVCRSVATAKEERREEDPLTRDYVDGADAVMADLLEQGYGDPEDLQTAYAAGGWEVELEP